MLRKFRSLWVKGWDVILSFTLWIGLMFIVAFLNAWMLFALGLNYSVIRDGVFLLWMVILGPVFAGLTKRF